VLQVERAVEVPQVQYEEVVTQVPRQEIQYVDKNVDSVRIEAREQLVEVQHTLYEERIVEVPQTQVTEVIRQVNRPNIKEVKREVVIYENDARENIVAAPLTLVQESAVEVPEVRVKEIVKQVAKQAQQQRIVHHGVEHEREVDHDEAVYKVHAEEFGGELKIERGQVVREEEMHPEEWAAAAVYTSTDTTQDYGYQSWDGQQSGRWQSSTSQAYNIEGSQQRWGSPTRAAVESRQQSWGSARPVYSRGGDELEARQVYARGGDELSNTQDVWGQRSVPTAGPTREVSRADGYTRSNQDAWDSYQDVSAMIPSTTGRVGPAGYGSGNMRY